MSALSFLNFLISGVSLGSIYAIIALGYTMVYGIAKMLNFAHGDVIMVGGSMCFCATTYLGWPAWMGVVLAVVVCTALGVVIERLAYKPLRMAPSLAVLITAIGVSYFLQNAALLIWSSNPKTFTSVVTGEALSLFGGQLQISKVTLVAIAACVVIMVALMLFTGKSKVGTAMRAVSEDKGAAQLMGINVNTTISITFAIGSGLAAIAGVLLCSAYPTLMPTTGSLPGIKAFTAAVFGGIGSIPGAFIGGILLGIIEIFAKAYISTQLSDAIVFAVLIVVLLVKPDGLLGKHVSEKVYGGSHMNKLKSYAASKRGRDTLLCFGIVIIAYIIVQAAIAGGGISSQIKGLLVPICAYVVMAISLNLTVGILGELSLGHAGFMSVGAFAGIVTTTCLADAIPLAPLRLAVAMIVGAVFAALAGVIVGVPVLRLKGDYLAIVTLAFGEIIKNVVNVMYLGRDADGLHFSLVEQNFQLGDGGKMIINGPIGVSGVTKISTFTSGVVLILVTLFFVLNFINSRTGRAVMAVRDNKIAADSIGISVTHYKLLAFVVSAAFAGAAGTLYAMNFSTVTAAKFDFNTSILVLVFVVLGGLGNIWGSIIAAALLTLLPELLRGLSNYRMLIYAVLLIAMMLFNNSSLKKRMLEKRGMKQMEKLEKAAKSGKEGA